MSSKQGKQSQRGVGNKRRRLMMVGAAAAAVLLAGGIWAATGAGPSSQAGAGTQASTSPNPATTTSPGPTAAVTFATPPVTKPTAATPSQRATAAAKAKADKALAAVPQATAAPVALASVSKPEAGVSVTVSKVEAVAGVAQGPGQVAGPSVRFTLTFTNNGKTAVNTGGAVVNVDTGANHVPALPLSGPGAVSFPASTGPGQSSSCTFVFLIPNNQRDSVRILFNYNVSSSIAAFEGAVPKAQG
ncbi:MAG: hypothetical protein WBX27_16835 [Specibacter sp.]